MGLKERMKERREELNITRSQMAKYLKITSAAVSNYEYGYSLPKADSIPKVCELLKCDPNYLYQDDIVLSEETYTHTEKELVKKYRELDNRGQNIVEIVVDAEHNISSANKSIMDTTTSQLMDLGEDSIMEDDEFDLDSFIDEVWDETIQAPEQQEMADNYRKQIQDENILVAAAEGNKAKEFVKKLEEKLKEEC